MICPDRGGRVYTQIWLIIDRSRMNNLKGAAEKGKSQIVQNNTIIICSHDITVSLCGHFWGK